MEQVADDDRHKTVLLADGNTSAREDTADGLTGHFRVLQAADGTQALATCRKEDIDVVIAAYNLPQLTGVQLCKALRDDPAAGYTPFMFISTTAKVSDRVTALRAGGDDFVARDVEPAELIARLEALVRIRSLVEVSRRSAKTHAVSAGIVEANQLSRRIGDEFELAKTNEDPLSLLVMTSATPDKDVWQRVATCQRANDTLVRRPREGSVMLLPNTHFGGAMASAEKVWHAAGDGVAGGGLTIGVACHPNPKIESASDLLEVAEKAHNQALSQGPGHICLHHHQAYLFRPE